MLGCTPLPVVIRRSMLVLMVGLGCRSSPTEAPEPDASMFPEEGFDPGPALGTTDPSSEPASMEARPPRPRAPHTIFRDEIQRAISPGPAYLLRQLGPEPFRHQGQFVGWEITQLFPDDPQLCATPCDIALGDVILGVNGHRLQTPQELSDALVALPRWTHLDVQSLRDGQRRRVTYTIVDE